MKISSDLRQVIRAVIEARNSKLGSQWDLRKKAVDELLSSNRWKARVSSANRELKKAKHLETIAGEFFNSIGLYCHGEGIKDEDKFIKSGGKIPFKSGKLNFNAAMSKIAAASEKDGRKLLLELGINWNP